MGKLQIDGGFEPVDMYGFLYFKLVTAFGSSSDSEAVLIRDIFAAIRRYKMLVDM